MTTLVEEPQKIASGIYVLGLGIKVVAQATLETNRIIQDLDFVVYIDPGNSVQSYLSQLDIQAYNVMDWYKEGEDRSPIYEKISEFVIEKSRLFKRVGYLAPGNPNLLNSVVSLLIKKCKEQELPLHIFPGISCIDTIINDLQLPIETLGLQCYDATHFGRLRPAIDISVPLFLFQPGHFNTSTVRFRDAPIKDHVLDLKKCLLDFYTPNTNWILVGSAGESESPSRIYWNSLNRLEEFYHLMGIGTLVLPGKWWPSYLHCD